MAKIEEGGGIRRRHRLWEWVGGGEGGAPWRGMDGEEENGSEHPSVCLSSIVIISAQINQNLLHYKNC